MAEFNRRDVLRILGLGTLAASVPLSLAAPRRAAARGRRPAAGGLGAAGPGTPPEDAAPSAAQGPWWMLAPLVPGARVATSRLLQVYPERTGAVTVELAANDGHRFRVDICRRDPAADAPAPVARTRHYDLFLANGGQGDKRTSREEGLAVYGLAHLLRKNEAHRTASLLTLRERWARFSRAEICTPVV